MDDDSRIIREFQRLSVSGFDQLKNYNRNPSIQQHNNIRYNNNNHHNHKNDNNDNNDDNDNKDDIIINLKPQNKPSRSFEAIQSIPKNGNNHKNDIEKYHNYIYDKNDNEYIQSNHNHYNHYNDNDVSSVSVDDIINDLKRRKEHRLNNKHNDRNNMHRNGSSISSISSHSLYHKEHLSPSPPINNTKYSRFMLAALNNNNNNNNNNHKNNKYRNNNNEIEKYKDIINDKDNEIKSLQKQLQEKEELIKSLQYKLLQQNENTQQQIFDYLEDIDNFDGNIIISPPSSTQQNMKPPKLNKHRRQKSMTQTQTEQSTIENVRWQLRSEISKMSTAQNEVNRLLQSVGDTSMIHGRLKKIHNTISVHKRKVSALEQTLNINEFGYKTIIYNDDDDDSDNQQQQQQHDNNNDNNNDDGDDDDFDERKLKNFLTAFNENDDEKKDFEILSKEYSKLKLQIAEFRQEENEWNNTKKELETINKRCRNLMNMLDKLSDEKLELTLQIEDLHALLHKNNITM